MIKLHVTIFSLLLLGATACSQGDETAKTETQQETAQGEDAKQVSEKMTKEESNPSEEQEINFTLSDWQAGEFKMMAKIPEAGETPYDIRKETITTSVEGENFEEVTHIASLGGEDHVTLIPKFNPETREYVNKISSIVVTSPRYKTPLGIGVGSTIQEFEETYPAMRCFYTYVSQTFWLETGSETTQFHLKPEDYQGTLNPQKDMEPIDPKGFKEGSKIIKVRMY